MTMNRKGNCIEAVGISCGLGGLVVDGDEGEDDSVRWWFEC